MISHNTQNWTVQKTPARSSKGVVASQVGTASQIGANILAAGGNAVDAAVATAFALATIEPGNSGLGGCGFMLVHRAGEKRAQVISFGPISPLKTDPSAYPLVSGETKDLFSWPAVLEGRNAHGPLSFATPGAVDGLGLAQEKWGRMKWADVLAPAIALADQGLPIDWFSSLRIANHAAGLRRYQTSRDIYLPDGLPPVAGLPMQFIKQGHLADTMRQLASAGRRDFYEGDIARDIIADCAAMGSFLGAEDLARYQAQILDPLEIPYRGHIIQAVPGLSAGPTLARVLGELQAMDLGAHPQAKTFTAYADLLTAAYQERLAGLGDVSKAETCTTHLVAVDREGTMVSVTNTLLSIFGSCVVLPKTGIMMNNGMFWFDPRPGHANSIGANKRPLTNMCPVIAARDGTPILATGASGGRRIMPAVLQLLSFSLDFGMNVEHAAHHPRIDASGTGKVDADPRLDSKIIEALRAAGHHVDLISNNVFPVNYACPSLIQKEPNGFAGIGDVGSPWAAAIAAV